MKAIEKYKVKNILLTILIMYGLISYYIFRNYTKFCEGIFQFNDKFVGLLFLLLFLGLGIVVDYIRNMKIKLSMFEWSLFAVMALCFVIDAGFQKQDSIYFVKTDFIYVILSVVSWTYIFSILFILFLKCQTTEKRKIHQLRLMLIILCFWTPYMIIFFPGATSWDGMYQLNQVAKIQELTNIQPVEITYLMGHIIKFGTAIISPEFGLFIYNLLQTLFMAYVLSYGLSVIKKMGCSDKAFAIVLVMMMLLPIPLFFTYVLLKDGFYASFCAWFCFILLNFYGNREEFTLNKMNYLLLGISEIGILFFRKNGIYVVILTTIILIVREKKWKTLLLISMFCIAVFTISDNYIENYFNVSNKNRAEIYSLPLQQTARYYTYYHDEFPKEEESLKKVVNIQAMVRRYNPQLSDPIKGFLNQDASDEQIQDFLRIWLKNFFRHPMVYMEAFLGNANGYLDPTGPMLSERGFFYMPQVTEKDAYTFSFEIKWLEDVRESYRKVFDAGEGIVIFGLLFQPGIYFWMLIFTTLSYLREKEQLWKCLVPLYITFLICLVSPVNGSIRYILPLIVSLPILQLLCLGNKGITPYVNNNKKFEENHNG